MSESSAGPELAVAVAAVDPDVMEAPGQALDALATSDATESIVAATGTPGERAARRAPSHRRAVPPALPHRGGRGLTEAPEVPAAEPRGTP